MFRKVCISLCLIGSSAATTYTIGPGQTYETFTDLTAAITLAGDDVVDGGRNTFTESWLLNGSGTAGHPITLQRAILNPSIIDTPVGPWSGFACYGGNDGEGRDATTVYNRTYFQTVEPINTAGTIDHIEWYLTQDCSSISVKVGLFYHNTGNEYRCRNYVTLTVSGTAMNKVSFDAPGDFTAFTVQSGDYVGWYTAASTGPMRQAYPGTGAGHLWYVEGDATSGASYAFTDAGDGRELSLSMSGTTDIWEATSTNVGALYFDDVEGSEKESVDLLTTTKDWLWSSNKYCVYSTTDPGIAWTEVVGRGPGIGINCGSQSYITAKQMVVSGASQGILLSGDNCTLQSSIIADSVGHGVSITGDSCSVINCDVLNAGENGLDVQASATVSNCIVRGSGDFDIEIPAGIVVNGATNVFEDSDRTGTGGILAPSSPVFLSPATAVTWVAPYGVSISTDTGNWGTGGAQTLELICAKHTTRIRQAGAVSRVKFYCASKTYVTGFYITVWRKSGSLYDRVGISENLASSLADATILTLDLSSPITGVQEGDYVGMRYVTSAANTGIITAINTGATASYRVSSEAPASDYAWESQTSSFYMPPIYVYEDAAPVFVAIGDSIQSGIPGHYSFCDTAGTTTDLTGFIAYHLSQRSGCITYQNMGIGSQTTSNIAARITTDLVNLGPRFAILQGGINDLNNLPGNPPDPNDVAAANALLISNWTTIIEACVNNNIVPIIIPITPWTNGSNAKMEIRDDWNADLAELASGYETAVVVDVGSYVGQYRTGGPEGNYWDQNPMYASTGSHYNSAGYAQIAEGLYDGICGTQLWSTDPLFVSSSNLRLQPNSPCRDAGTNVGMTADYLNNHVPAGSGPDIGAYEYQLLGLILRR
jgi:lysophospholipase L1-like esterase